VLKCFGTVPFVGVCSQIDQFISIQFLIGMSNLMRLRYRGYTAILQQDLDSAIWHGRVADIRDIVSFEGKTAAHAEAEFRKAVDVYLACCQLDDRNPNQPNGLTSLS
jgi:predicted RNase H-like HicB family nuclease